MSVLDQLAEARVAAALAAGEFENLPGAGKPLALDDDPLVPEHLRVAYRMLRNAGFVPPELAERRERLELAALVATLDDDAERRRACARLSLLEARAEAAGRLLAAAPEYRDRLAAKLGRR